MKRALITGITGQDGSYLAEFLLRMGYEVHGLKRRSSTFNTERLDSIYADFHEPDNRLFLYYADLADNDGLWKLLYEIQPDEIYNLAAQSHSRVAFDLPEATTSITAYGALRLMEAIRGTGIRTRLFQASSAEMYGDAPPPQNEQTLFRPCSPLGCAKLYAHWLTVSYREAYRLFASCGILFNHESPRRGETFVTRKITRFVARAREGLESKLYLGNLKARRDWGYAPEYVEAMWRILQQDAPDDFVLGTGNSHTVSEFVEEAFSYAGLDWREFVETDVRYLRPREADVLEADASKASEILEWRPVLGFQSLVRLMVDADTAAVRNRWESRRVAAAAGR